VFERQQGGQTVWNLSGFSDEIAADFEEQCSHIRGLGMSYLEFRSAWDTNVLALSDDQLATVKQTLQRHELTVSCIGSPVGKSSIEDDFEPVLEQMRTAAGIAGELGTRYIRIFSFYLPEGADPADYRTEVIRRLSALAQIADAHGLVLLHENEVGIYGDIPQRCHDLVTSVDSPNLRLTWDPANFVHSGVAPFDDGYALLRPFVEYLQIKDAVASTGAVVAAGRGDAQVAETIRALRSDGFDGFFSLEPHLGHATGFGGFSGPELFTDAWGAFTSLVTNEGIDIS
jgi:sugar phosphate isomerase/epimerase